MIPYSVEAESITCGQCGMTSHHADDVYFRYCGYCRTLLGPEIRQRWNLKRRELFGLCETFGRYKKVVVNGIARRVPTERIATEGFRASEADGFPVWIEEGVVS